jgi:hypothetical protein
MGGEDPSLDDHAKRIFSRKITWKKTKWKTKQTTRKEVLTPEKDSSDEDSDMGGEYPSLDDHAQEDLLEEDYLEEDGMEDETDEEERSFKPGEGLLRRGLLNPDLHPADSSVPIRPAILDWSSSFFGWPCLYGCLPSALAIPTMAPSAIFSPRPVLVRQGTAFTRFITIPHFCRVSGGLLNYSFPSTRCRTRPILI